MDATETKVVNCKVKYIRPQYANLKEWIEDTEHNAYIGRSGLVFIDKQRYPPAQLQSPFANPFKIGKDGDRDVVIKRYREYIQNKLDKSEEL